jgi:hypothetical protein
VAAGNEVHTSAALGWDRLVNGELLQAAEDAGFQLFVTGDQNLAYQQNLSKRVIAIVELSNNHWPSIRPHAEEILATINSMSSGDYRRIACPRVWMSRKRRH